MTKTLADMIYEDLQGQVKATNKKLATATAQSERAETSAGHPSGTLASAPLAANGARAGDQYFVTNGRKVGEGAGAGTGVMAYYNPATNSWYSGASDTAVLT